MSKMKKILKVTGILILVLLAVVILGRNIMIPMIAKSVLKNMTGLTLEMEKFDVGLFSTKIDIQGLKILNPDGYEDRLMLDAPKIYVDYDLTDLLGGDIHINDLKFFLNEFVVVKRADGSSNLDGIMKLISKDSGKPAGKKPAAPEKEKAKTPDIRLDMVEIRIGKFVSKSYAKSGKADVKEIRIDIDKRYENKSIEVIAADLSQYIFKVLLQMAANLNLGDVGEALTGTIGSIGELGIGTAKKGLKAGKDVVDNAANVLKDTTKGLTDVIKLPFGGK